PERGRKHIPRVTAGAHHSSSRQTQNPERGRKRVKPPPASPGPPRSSDPKPREGTETFRRQFVDHEFSESSDPKPREGTETLGIPCADSGFACRQTQNPERGRKPGEQRRRQPGGHGSVVRPKTPRGDGNQVSNGGGNLAATGRSSDPKPRERTETRRRSRRCRCPNRRVVRPKTPRGDGNFVDHHCHSLSPRVVRPKTPRGDGNLE
ncbi:hypothetical protein AN74_04087, partial [Mycobacterium tuberculosis M1294]